MKKSNVYTKLEAAKIVASCKSLEEVDQTERQFGYLSRFGLNKSDFTDHLDKLIFLKKATLIIK